MSATRGSGGSSYGSPGQGSSGQGSSGGSPGGNDPRCPSCGSLFTHGSIDKRDGRFKCSNCVRRGIVNQAGVVTTKGFGHICHICNGMIEHGHRGCRKDGQCVHLECAPNVLTADVRTRTIFAKYDGNCAICRQDIRGPTITNPGQIITSSYMGWGHPNCVAHLPDLLHFQQLLAEAAEAGVHDWNLDDIIPQVPQAPPPVTGAAPTFPFAVPFVTTTVPSPPIPDPAPASTPASPTSLTTNDVTPAPVPTQDTESGNGSEVSEGDASSEVSEAGTSSSSSVVVVAPEEQLADELAAGAHLGAA